MPARKRPDIVARAKELIAARNMKDIAIAKQMKREGKQIGHKTVGKIRRAAGIPYLPKRQLAPDIAARANQLIDERRLDDKAIAMLMRQEQKPISVTTIRNMRQKKRLPLLSSNFGVRKTTARTKQLTALRNKFKSLSPEKRIAEWNRLNQKRRLIANRLTAIRGGRERVVMKADQKAMMRLLDHLAEIRLQCEALLPLLPEEIQRADATALAPFVRNWQ